MGDVVMRIVYRLERYSTMFSIQSFMYNKRGILFEQGACLIFVQVQLIVLVTEVVVRVVDRFEGNT